MSTTGALSRSPRALLLPKSPSHSWKPLNGVCDLSSCLILKGFKVRRTSFSQMSR
jgi:hypothetical protein